MKRKGIKYPIFSEISSLKWDCVSFGFLWNSTV